MTDTALVERPGEVSTGPLATYAITTGTSLAFKPETTYEAFEEVVAVITGLDLAADFWLGDAFLYGEDAFGEQASQAMSATRMTAKGLTNRVWVSRKVPSAIRRGDLSWSHHAIVAGLDDVAAMEAWLAKAAAEGWNVQQLTRAIRGTAGPGGGTDVEPEETGPNIGQIVDDAVRGCVEAHIQKHGGKDVGKWAAKTFGNEARRGKVIGAWGRAVRKAVEKTLDAGA